MKRNRGFLRSCLRSCILGARKAKKTLAPAMPYNYFINPVGFNNRLNAWERKHGKTKLLSYPRTVEINLSALCNQDCLFCFHDNRYVKNKNWLEPDLFKRMKWLRFVETIDLFAWGGESLLNPHFPEIVKIVRKVAPHSKLGVFTNAQALEGENLDAVLSLDHMNVSLNAVSKVTFDRVLHGDYERTMRNLEEFGKRKPSSLYANISMVLVRQNLHEVKALIELGVRLHFNRVVLCDFGYFWYREDHFRYEDSFVNDLSMKEDVRKLSGYAKSLGIDFFYPEPNLISGECQLPWTLAMLKTDFEGNPQFQQCCYSRTGLNLSMNEDCYVHFKKVWNHPRMQLIRKTVNCDPAYQNRMCYLCRIIDTTKALWLEDLIKLCRERFGFAPIPNPTYWYDVFPEAKA